MLSKNKIKYITSLAKKKFRDEEGVFLAEGAKVVGDILPYFRCQLLCGTKEFLTQHPQIKAAFIYVVFSLFSFGKNGVFALRFTTR